MSKSLLDIWVDASKDLSVKIVPSPVLKLPCGVELRTVLLVRDFGAKNGMLIVSDYSEVKPCLNEIAAASYGFSVMDDPGANGRYNRDSFMEMLRDWSWSGEKSEKPSWL